LRVALTGVAFILAIFGCVVLHELGHALTARRYKIRTRDITLLPIGGIARLERMPTNPAQEFWVAAAGPAVNVVIAILLFFVIAAMSGLEQLANVSFRGGNFLVNLMWVNLFLVAFNLLPAFPMDGGRILRALLAGWMDYRKATRIAASIGQVMAVLFGLAGLFYFKNIFLVLIAIFVFLGAQAEAQMVEVNSSVKGATVRDAMMTRFRTLSATDSLDKAVSELLAGSQQDFPVLTEEGVAGILRRNDLVKALAGDRRQTVVGDVMSVECKVVGPDDPLDRVFEHMRQRECATLPVLSQGRLVGLLTLENVAELLMVNSALNNQGRPTPPLLRLDGDVRRYSE